MNFMTKIHNQDKDLTNFGFLDEIKDLSQLRKTIIFEK